ncbi:MULTISPECIES: TonB-dependent receptor plug domain-containing protein [Acinetobacter]|uniref:TonB-dependent receptor plug domain-containing protein n=1 Tax=Acinetobacter TaxID=469 RepID=UPI00029CAAA4|nr:MULTISPECIES: TonB-dependent receptor [Acinetobacter]EKU39218.1 TonB-dependent receptor [Acinetobacter sp. WC-141]MBM7140125.1 TonB-dependent receptor [Acinetobacter sp. 105-3]
MEHVMSKSFQPTRLVGAIAIAMGFSPVIFAEDTTNATQLDPIVVTASKSAEKASEVPARISVISKEEIEKNPTSNLSNILQKDASIYVKQNGGLGQGTNLLIRGTNPNHVLLLKDGARLNTPNTLSPIYPELLDTTNLDRIEILKGPASVQYGTDAIGGVIQMITSTPERNSAFVTGIYGEDNTYKAIIGTDLVSDAGFFAQIRGQSMESDGTHIFNTQPDNLKAAYDQKGYSAKLGYDNKNNLNTIVEISQNKGANNYSDNGGISNTAKREFDNQLVSTRVEYKPTSNITINTRYSNFKDTQEYRESSPYHADTKRNEGDLNVKWQFTQAQNILVGASIDNTEYQDASILNGKQDIDSTGYYLQHQYKTDKISTQLGVRLEDNEKFGTHNVGQGAVRYFVLPSTSIYANIGTAFRAPSLTELYYHSEADYGSGGIYHTYGNTNLKPEESTSYEIGLDHQFTPALTAYLSVYKTDVKNLIASSSSFDAATNTTTSTYENLNKARFSGGEAGFKWKQDDLFLSTEYAYVKTENKETGLEIAYRPKQTLTLTTGLENTVYGISASLIARSNSNAQNSANPQKVPGYATVDLNAYWNINPNVKVFTNIENVGDSEYKTVYNFGNWYVNGGRQASVGVTFRY